MSDCAAASGSASARGDDSFGTKSWVGWAGSRGSEAATEAEAGKLAWEEPHSEPF